MELAQCSNIGKFIQMDGPMDIGLDKINDSSHAVAWQSYMGWPCVKWLVIVEEHHHARRDR